MDKNNNNNLTRRGFIKTLGGGVLATAAVMTGCTGKKAQGTITYGGSTEILGDMTYRTIPLRATRSLSSATAACVGLRRR